MALIKHSAPARDPANDRREAPRDFAGLCLALNSAEATVRRWAARDLTPLPGASSPLLGRLQRESDVSVRAVILTALIRIADPAAIAGLVQCLRSEDANLRNEAIEAMKALPINVAPIIQRLLVDKDPDVRIFAINILGSLRHPDVEAWLLAVIEHEPLVNVCGTAIDLLSEVGSSAAHDALVRVRARFAEEPYIQFATALALKRIAPG